jgi:hypothetical protein
METQASTHRTYDSFLKNLMLPSMAMMQTPATTHKTYHVFGENLAIPSMAMMYIDPLLISP